MPGGLLVESRFDDKLYYFIFI